MLTRRRKCAKESELSTWLVTTVCLFFLRLSRVVVSLICIYFLLACVSCCRLTDLCFPVSLPQSSLFSPSTLHSQGGVSSSRFESRTDKSDNSNTTAYASFNGKIRTNGGGFCGFRTRPFQSPIALRGKFDGVYIDAAFLSDKDVNKRNWKVSVRNDASRGELTEI